MGNKFRSVIRNLMDGSEGRPGHGMESHESLGNCWSFSE